MKHAFLGAFALLLSAVSCSDDDDNNGSGTPENLVTPKISARITEQVAQDAPFTGILEIFPCRTGGSDYFGNYINGKLTIFNGYYTIVQGDVYGNNICRSVLTTWSIGALPSTRNRFTIRPRSTARASSREPISPTCTSA